MLRTGVRCYIRTSAPNTAFRGKRAEAFIRQAPLPEQRKKAQTFTTPKPFLARTKPRKGLERPQPLLGRGKKLKVPSRSKLSPGLSKKAKASSTTKPLTSRIEKGEAYKRQEVSPEIFKRPESLPDRLEDGRAPSALVLSSDRDEAKGKYATTEPSSAGSADAGAITKPEFQSFTMKYFGSGTKTEANRNMRRQDLRWPFDPQNVENSQVPDSSPGPRPVQKSHRRTALGPKQPKLYYSAPYTESRRLLRTTLRECTYLPDSHARKWTAQYVLERFRYFRGIAQVPKHISPAAQERFRKKLTKVRQMARRLRRANNGERKPLLKALLMAYGRTGKRRRELLQPLLPDRDTTNAGVKEETVGGVAKPRRIPELPPQLHALAASQIRYPPSQLTRPNLRRMAPVIPEENSWLRSMPKTRAKNQAKKWYAEFLDKVHPPLPAEEWARLRDLASGTLQDNPVPRRKHIEGRPPSALELVLHGEVGERPTNDERDAHALTPRYMRRLWAQVFAQCPSMTWDTVAKKWEVRWGEHELHNPPSELDLEAQDDDT